MPLPGGDLPVQHSYFFDDGLRFACLRCGACCTGEPGTVYVASDEIASIASYLDQPVQQFVRDYLHPFRDSYSIREDHHGNCLFFRKRCLIYAVRPKQCRSWPFWLSNLRSEKSWAKARQLCPGIGRGRIYSRDQIIARIEQNMHL